jgi:hypothetical protein
MNIERALDLLEQTFTEAHPTATFEDLREELATSPLATLWLGERSVVFLRMTEHDTGERVLEASPAAGDLDEILTRGTAEIEMIARENGCSQIQVRAGRGGWERALKAHGYDVTAVIMRKLVCDG